MAVVSAGAVLRAQSGDSAASSAQTPPAKPADAAPQAQAARVISPEAASLLAQAAPKYNPPKPEDNKAAQAPAALSEADRPKNEVIRLPEMVVGGEKVPSFTEREIYSPSGLSDLAMKRYVGDPNAMPSDWAASASRFLFSSYALEQYREEERLSTLRDLKDTAVMFNRAGDKDEADYIRTMSRDTYQQQGDFGSAAPDVPTDSLFHYLSSGVDILHSGSSP